jgi:hypothetical protein
MLTALLLYGYCVGVRSSRRIEGATWRDVAFRVIAGDHHPDHTVISEFRRVHLTALGGLFLETVRLAQHAGLVRLGQVALDGTKMRANASKHKAMSHGRMRKTESELRAEIARLLAEAEATDRAEDELHGVGRRGDELPAELRRRTDRLRRIEEARSALEAEARESRARTLSEQAARQQAHSRTAENPVERQRAATRARQAEERAAALRGDDEGRPPTGGGSSDAEWPRHRVPATPEGAPTPQAQRNFTDPESRIMKRDGGYLQGYNCQAAVDGERQVIVACGATNQAPDVEHLPPAVEQIRAVCGQYPEQLLADAGYWASAHVDFCAARGIDPFLVPWRKRPDEPRPNSPPEKSEARVRMARKLATPEGRAVYGRRKVIAEPVFGQIRVVLDFHGFLLRGLRKVGGEWSLVCAAHNLRKLHRAARAIPA